MTLLDFKSFIQRIFYTMIFFFVVATFILLFVYTDSLLKFDEVKVRQTKNMAEHLLKIEDRFIVEEFMSLSYTAIQIRVDRALKLIGIQNSEIAIYESDKCVFAKSKCNLKDFPELFIFRYPIVVLNEKFGEILVGVPKEVFTRGLSYNNGIKMFAVPFLILLLLFVTWFKYVNKKVIGPYLLQLLNLEKKLAIQRVSRQVAHDIRSPLSILETFELSGFKDQGKQKLLRSVILRIREIASDLLEGPKGQGEKQKANLYLLIKNCLKLKELEYKDKEIEFSLSAKTISTFSNIPQGLFNRALSNIINNSVEALGPQGGRISIEIFEKGDNVYISVKDDGVGISKESLKRIFEEGFTTKKAGNGLGLSKVKNVLENVGGSISVKSKKGSGTQVKIKLPLTEPPTWFVGKINLDSSKRIMCLDDDPFYLNAFSEKLSSFKSFCFTDYRTFTNSLGAGDILFVDYDFKGAINGLELITQNNYQNQAYLVTNLDEDIELVTLCVEHGVRLIPKDLFFDKNFKIV